MNLIFTNNITIFDNKVQFFIKIYYLLFIFQSQINVSVFVIIL